MREEGRERDGDIGGERWSEGRGMAIGGERWSEGRGMAIGGERWSEGRGGRERGGWGAW